MLEVLAFQQKQCFIYDKFIMKRILLEQAFRRETAPRQGFFTLIFVKETTLFCLYFQFSFSIQVHCFRKWQF